MNKCVFFVSCEYDWCACSGKDCNYRIKGKRCAFIYANENKKEVKMISVIDFDRHESSVIDFSLPEIVDKMAIHVEDQGIKIVINNKMVFCNKKISSCFAININNEKMFTEIEQ